MSGKEFAISEIEGNNLRAEAPEFVLQDKKEVASCDIEWSNLRATAKEFTPCDASQSSLGEMNGRGQGMEQRIGYSPSGIPFIIRETEMRTWLQNFGHQMFSPDIGSLPHTSSLISRWPDGTQSRCDPPFHRRPTVVRESALREFYRQIMPPDLFYQYWNRAFDPIGLQFQHNLDAESQCNLNADSVLSNDVDKSESIWAYYDESHKDVQVRSQSENGKTTINSLVNRVSSGSVHEAKFKIGGEVVSLSCENLYVLEFAIKILKEKFQDWLIKNGLFNIEAEDVLPTESEQCNNQLMISSNEERLPWEEEDDEDFIPRPHAVKIFHPGQWKVVEGNPDRPKVKYSAEFMKKLSGLPLSRRQPPNWLHRLSYYPQLARIDKPLNKDYWNFPPIPPKINLKYHLEIKEQNELNDANFPLDYYDEHNVIHLYKQQNY